MRCPDCNKFVAYDDSQEPEADASVDDEGDLSGDVRVVLPCSECGTELKEATFDLSAVCEHSFYDEFEQHKKEAKEKDELANVAEDDREDHTFEAEVEDIEMTTRVEGKGRGAKTFYGFHATIAIKCSCAEFNTNIELNDDMQASSMDELT